MMITSEYGYEHANLGCASSYLLPAINRMLESVPPGAQVLDFGCGTGSMLGQFAERGWKLHGIDVSVSGIEQARKAYPFINFDVADLMADLSGHPLTGTFDVVLSTEVIEHVFLPRRFLANSRIMLKPTGMLILSTPYHGYLKNLLLAASGKLDAHFTALWDYGHIKFWSPHTLSTALQDCGFHVGELRGLGRVPYLWKSMIVRATPNGTVRAAF